MSDNVIISNQNMGGKTNSTLWPRCILPRTRPKGEKRYFEASINRSTGRSCIMLHEGNRIWIARALDNFIRPKSIQLTLSFD